MFGHRQDLALLRQAEGIGLLGIVPGGIAPAADVRVSFVIDGSVRQFDADRRPFHPDVLAGDGLLPGRLDADDGKARVPDGDRIVLIDTLFAASDDIGLGQVDAVVGDGQFPFAAADDIRLRREDHAEGREIRNARQGGQERAGFGVQRGVDAFDLDAGHAHGAFDGFRRFFVFLLAGEQAEGQCQDGKECHFSFHVAKIWK